MQLASRQVHLDFHTSEAIPGIGADFDPAAFAATVRDAAINSMTVFARCHHGWVYYQSERFPGIVHPHLVRPNLLVEQIDALHSVGVRAPVYITVQWDHHIATTRPEWLIRKPGGAHEGPPFTEPGFYQSLCVNSGYFDYVSEMTREVCELLGGKLDGIFFDIVGIRPCCCAACRREMDGRGIDWRHDAEAVRHFAKFSIDRFKERMSALVRSHRPEATIFYNAGHVGPCTRASHAAYSHYELESLPSGSWGYLHFPVSARYARTLGHDALGMTGKFHTEWGDFHSLKNRAALEFECFRMLSFGFAASVGDQLEPRGVLQKPTYDLIGSVYRQLAEREAWARPSVPLVEAALVTPEPIEYEHAIPETIFGAVQLLDELGLQYDIVDFAADWSRYPLLILPDDLHCDILMQGRLSRYLQAGGRVLACGQGGSDPLNGEWPAEFGARHQGREELWPSFVLPQGELARDLVEENPYVIYLQGEAIAPLAPGEVLLTKEEPWFTRTAAHFCSHRYTPSAHGDRQPAAIRTANTILFAHPLFSQYRENAPLWVKLLIRNAIDLLLPRRLVRHDGPSTLTVSLLDQPGYGRAALHLLSYVPVRKSARIDLIEERTRVHDVTVELALPYEIRSARLVPEGHELPLVDGCLTIPEIDGYAIVELAYE